VSAIKSFQNITAVNEYDMRHYQGLEQQYQLQTERRIACARMTHTLQDASYTSSYCGVPGQSRQAGVDGIFRAQTEPDTRRLASSYTNNTLYIIS